MKICPQCKSTNIPDSASKCPYCLYSFGDTVQQNTKKPSKPDKSSEPDVVVEGPKKEGPYQEGPKKEGPYQNSPSGNGPYANPPIQTPKKSVNKVVWIIPIAIVWIVILILILKSCGAKDEKANSQSPAHTSSQSSGSSQSSSKNNSSSKKKGDVSLLNHAKEIAENADAEYEAGNYFDGAMPLYVEAINEFMTVAGENNLQEEAGPLITSAYDTYKAATIRFCDNILAQGAYSGCYTQINATLTDAISLTESIGNNGYYADGSELYVYKNNLVATYRDIFIQTINKVTEYENWSRNEAWGYAEQAYQTQENGTTVLFSVDDLEDPLRMRYEYCLAWITRKNCETALADGSMTYIGAVQQMDAILKETDYNPMLLEDIIYYGSCAGMNVDKYCEAYDAIINEIWSDQGLSIGYDVDLNHFWYFNDLDGEDKYKVSDWNGTTAHVRDWIRSNVPVILGE